MAGVSRLDLPSRKMFVKDLQRAVEIMDTRGLTYIKSWSVILGNNSMSFSVVWLQGKVMVYYLGIFDTLVTMVVA